MRIWNIPVILMTALLLLTVGGCDLDGVLQWISRHGDTNQSEKSPDDQETIQINEEDFTVSGIQFSMLNVQSAKFPRGVEDNATSEVQEAFWIAETPVTYELWYEVRTNAEERGYTFENEGNPGNVISGESGIQPEPDNAQVPVHEISWRDAVVWLNALSEIMGKAPVYRDSNGEVLKISKEDKTDGEWNDALSEEFKKVENNGYDGFRLPTGNEWELSSRWIGTQKPCEGQLAQNAIKINQDNGMKYYWTPGNYASGALDCVDNKTETDKVAWYNEEDGKSTEVRNNAPNELGLYDMSGNVEEWCFDSYIVDSGGEKEFHRIHRGGGAGSSRETLQVGSSRSMFPHSYTPGIGFRIARNNP